MEIKKFIKFLRKFKNAKLEISLDEKDYEIVGCGVSFDQTGNKVVKLALKIKN